MAVCVAFLGVLMWFINYFNVSCKCSRCDDAVACIIFQVLYALFVKWFRSLAVSRVFGVLKVGVFEVFPLYNVSVRKMFKVSMSSS